MSEQKLFDTEAKANWELLIRVNIPGKYCSLMTALLIFRGIPLIQILYVLILQVETGLLLKERTRY